MSRDDYQTDPSCDHDQAHAPTADEISEQVVGSYFAKAWGARPLDAAPLDAAPLDAAPRDAVPLDAIPLDAIALEAVPLDAAPLELDDFKRPFRPPTAMYISGFVKASIIAETIMSSPEKTMHVPHAKIPAEVLRRRDEIRVLAVKVLGSPREAERWLETPIRFSLEGRRPTELLQTLEGCDKVEQLLNNLYS
jgi:hypothetical protein